MRFRQLPKGPFDVLQTDFLLAQQRAGAVEGHFQLCGFAFLLRTRPSLQRALPDLPFLRF